MSSMLRGSRIILRPISEADFDLMDRMNQDFETMRFVGGTETSQNQLKEIVRTLQDRFKSQGWGWMGIETHQGEKLGFVFLRRCPRLAEIELGYRLCRDYWGKGYATESAQLLLLHGFKELRFNPIVAAVDPLNTASERILQRIGMQYWKDVDWETTPSGFARCYKATIWDDWELGINGSRCTEFVKPQDGQDEILTKCLKSCGVGVQGQ
jgi:[ribosomal protein S5]-alanine N-acetyltransferase